MNYIDAHIHFFVPSQSMYQVYLDILGDKNLEKVFALVFSSDALDIEKTYRLVPKHVKGFVKGLTEFRSCDSFFEFVNKHALSQKVVPFIDDRALVKNVRATLEEYKKMGFVGIKSFYLPERDEHYIDSFMDVFSISLADYQKTQREMFAFASENEMPIMCHTSVKKYPDFIEGLLREFKNVRVCIPHFGYSRRSIAPLLEKYENFYTDISSLLGLMKKQKEEYVEFMDRHREKILLGTDGPGFEKASDYANFLEKNLSGEAFRKIARGNALRFLF